MNLLTLKISKKLILSILMCMLLPLSGCGTSSSKSHTGLPSSVTAHTETDTMQTQSICTTQALTIAQTEVDKAQKISRTFHFDKDNFFLGDSTQESITLLGLPDIKESFFGIVHYMYKAPKPTELAFYDNQLVYVDTRSEEIVLLNNVRVGSSILEALRAFSIPKMIEDMEINEKMTDYELKLSLQKESIDSIKFALDDGIVADLSFDLKSLRINHIVIYRSLIQNELMINTPADLHLDFQGIIAKYGVPKYIDRYGNQAMILEYSDNQLSFSISLVNVNNKIQNSILYLSSDEKLCSINNDFKIGDDVFEIIKKHGIPDNAFGLPLSDKISKDDLFKCLTYWNSEPIMRYRINGSIIELIVSDDSSEVLGWTIYSENRDLYPVTLAKMELEIQKFDPETMLSGDDYAFTNNGVGNTRKEVFQRLGAPISSFITFDNYHFYSQHCVFKDGEVFFFEIEDYNNLDTGYGLKYSIRTPRLMGPRGIRVGDSIEKILEVIPGNDEIDFSNLTHDEQIYPYPYKHFDDTNSAIVRPLKHKKNSGIIHFRVEWVLDMEIRYEDGVITEISFSAWLS